MTKYRGHIQLIDNYLYFANDGEPFSRKGVLAVTNPNLSDKTHDNFDEPVDQYEHIKNEKEWIKKIRESALDGYELDNNRIITDRKREEGSLKDYAGRWIFEILQNMDDAMLSDKKKFIGTKGLGFLSILEVGNTPEIFSSNFGFKFDKNLTSKDLKKIGLAEINYKKPPSFTVPHDTEPDQVVKSLLEQDYKTVIKLKVNEISKSKITEELKNLDFNFIILSQIMNSLSIEIEENYKIRIEKKYKNLSNKDNFFKNKVEVKFFNLLNKSQKIFHWVLWGYEWQSSSINKQNSSCILAIPFKDKEPDLDCESRQIYNFYPTDKNSNTPLLIHITFNLSQNRKELLLWGDEKDWNSEECNNENKVLIEYLRSLMEKIVFDDLLKPTDILKIARNLCQLDRHTTEVLTVEEKIQEEIYDVVSNSNFIPVYGKKLIKPTDIRSWEDDFPYYFEENETIAKYNLPIKKINQLSEIYQNFSEKKIGENFFDVFNVFKRCKLKSSNNEERYESLRFLLKIFNKKRLDNFEYDFRESLEQVFLNQKIFLDDDNKLICLLDGPFFLKKINKVPSCIKIKLLSDESKKLVNELIFNNDETHKSIKLIFKKYLFEQYEDILNFLPSLLNKWNDEDKHSNNSNEISSWNNYGFEVLKYLLNIYYKNKEIDFDDLKNFIKLPTRQNKYWNFSCDIYLTKDWGVSKSLNLYLKDQNKELEDNEFILEKKKFLEAINKKNLEEKEVSSFIKKLGVHYAPALYSDGTFKNLEDQYFIEDKDRLQTFEIMLDSLLASGKYNAKGAEDLFDLKIVEFVDNIFYPDGFISLRDIYNQANQEESNDQKITKIIPIFGLQQLKEKIGEGLLKKIVKLIESHSSIRLSYFTDEDYWWSRQSLDSFINELLKKNEISEITDQNSQRQIRILTNFLEKNLGIQNNLKYYPCYKINNAENSIVFKSENIIFNDTELSKEQICEISCLEQYGLYVKEKSKLNTDGKLTFLLSELIDIKPNYDEVSKDVQTNIMARFNEKKDFIVFVGDVKVDELIKELKNMIFCNDLKLSIFSKTLDNSTDNKKQYEVDYYNNGEKLFVKIDQSKDDADRVDNVIRLLCKNLFEDSKIFLIIKAIFYAKQISEVKKIFKDNVISFQDFEDRKDVQFKIINHENLNISKTLRENSSVNDDEQKNPDDLKINIDNKNENIEGDKNNFIKNKLDINDIIKNNSSASFQDKQISDKNKLEKNYKSNNNKPSTNPKFGRRLSGHIRPNNPDGVNVRQYFDDQHESNKEIGEKGERIIFEILKSKYGKENVEFFGGNKEGFDMQYKENEQTYFVEVKSLQGSWDDNDILLTRPQFEKARKEKQLFILYVIEHLGSSEKQEITTIQNPISFFSKLQLDHGWKNFKTSSEGNPTVNDFILYKDKKYKIKKIKKIGSRIRLYFKNHDPLIFNKNKMKVLSE